MFGLRNILKYVKYLMALAQIVPALMDLIKAVEGTGDGHNKKGAVLELLDISIDTIKNQFSFDLPHSLIMAFSEKAVDTIVSFYNLSGYFKKEKKI